MGATLILLTGCSNLAGCVDNIGTTYAHLTPTGKIMTTGGTSYLQLSSQEWKKNVEVVVADSPPPQERLANRPPRLLYAEISGKEKRSRWNQLRPLVESGAKPLIAEEQLPTREAVTWERYAIASGPCGPGEDKPPRPAIRVQHGPSQYVAKPLVLPALAIDVVVTPCLWTYALIGGVVGDGLSALRH